MSNKSNKRSMLVCAITLLLCVSMVVGSTYAWFTDVVATEDNVIASGELKMKLGYKNNWNDDFTYDNDGVLPKIFNYTLWEPGYTVVKYFEVANVGSLSFRYTLNITTEGTADEAKLAEVIDVYLANPATEIATRADVANMNYVGTLADVMDMEEAGKLTNVLEAGKADTVAVALKMKESAGNDYQGLKIDGFDMELIAVQYTGENDSFGSDYDAEAGTLVYTPNQLKEALNAGKNVTLGSDINLNETLVIPAPATTFAMRTAPAPVVIDLDGYEIVGTMHKNEGSVIRNEGILILKNGTVSSTADNGGSAIYNAEGATLVLQDVTLNGAPKSGSEWPSYAINSYGDLTIKSANITSNHGALALYGDTIIYDANVTLNGIGGSSHVFYIGGEGTEVTVNGGTYTHKGNIDGSLAYIMTGTSMIINGGTFTASNGGYGLATYTGSLTVNGGTFANAFLDWGGPISISGGTFASNPAAKYLASGYKAVESNGKYVVVANNVGNVITTADELLALGGKSIEGVVYIANDIDMNGAAMPTIGAAYGKSLTVVGNGYTISNATTAHTNHNGMKHHGFFYAYTNSTLTISDLTFKNITIDATKDTERNYGVGVVVAFADGGSTVTLNNVDVINSTVKNTTPDIGDEAGVYVGYQTGTLIMTDCDSTGCSVAGETAEKTGAFIGMVNGTANLTNCTTDLTIGACNRIGGKLTIDGAFVLAAATNEALNSAISAGNTSVNLPAGNYTMPEINLQGKTLTIKGDQNVVLDVSAVDARNQFVTGATLVFDGVTLNFGTANYMGFANTASLTYKNCNINGLQFLFGESVVFENCNLNSNGAEHCVWTYGAKNVSFTDCDFTYGDRGINCYSDNDVVGGKQTVNFTDCTFTTTNAASEGAVEINSCFFSVGVEVNMDGCTAPAYGEMAYVSRWDSTNGAKTTINIK